MPLPAPSVCQRTPQGWLPAPRSRSQARLPALLADAVRGKLADVDCDRAAVEMVIARERLDERGLAGPVGSHERTDRTGLHHQVDARQRLGPAEVLGCPLDEERGRAGA